MGETIRPVRFSLEDTIAAGTEWGMNCGPGALCAMLGLTPGEIRPLMGNFESKGYTDPKLMFEVLARSGVGFERTFRSDEPGEMPPVTHGLVRIQWSGPWVAPGTPMMDRWRKTHWIGMRADSSDVFDINAMCVGGWLPFAEWSQKLVPWLCGECVPEWDGTWWPTHVIEVQPK